MDSIIDMTEQIDPHRAIEFIAKNAGELASAKGQRIYLENYLKVVKAQRMNYSESSSLGQKEIDAYASKEYLEVVEALKVAVENETKLYWLIQAAQAKIECWKTMEYSKRQEMKNL